MTSVYFDTSVFVALFGGKDGPTIKGLLRELKQDKVKIYTSILTVQEVSVAAFMRGSVVTDNHTKVSKLARIYGITKEIALTAAKYEAVVREAAKGSGERPEDTEQNRRRKWDCFHMATAVAMHCQTVYTLDNQFATKRRQLGLETVISVSPPTQKRPSLFPINSDQVGTGI
ncbi:MAG: PIN domain-containing protein [Luteitalea sp.]|nr:PIN domain-containing protein [Luteitalea sp.]